jgi:hypothetical protein
LAVTTVRTKDRAELKRREQGEKQGHERVRDGDRFASQIRLVVFH